MRGEPEVHRRVALDHDHDVAERRDVRAAGGRRAEQAADLRHPARQPHLVVEDAARAAAAGEQLDLIGDAGAGRVDEPERPAARARSAYSVSRTIFSTVRAPHEPAFTVGSLAITHTGRPSTVPTPVTTPSAGRSSAERVGEQRRPRRTSPSSSSRASRSRTNSLSCAASLSPSLARGCPASARSVAAQRQPSRPVGRAVVGRQRQAAADGEDGDVVGDGAAGEVAGRLEQGLAQHVGVDARDRGGACWRCAPRRRAGRRRGPRPARRCTAAAGRRRRAGSRG